MRINLYVATATGLSRRAADREIEAGHVTINGRQAVLGDQVSNADEVCLNSQPLALHTQPLTIILNKPVGYVCSRDGQGSKTIYDLLPPDLHNLKPVGRLDKDSSGLLLMTTDGQLANQLTHPKFAKDKVYQVELDKSLTNPDRQRIEKGVELEDGLSRLNLHGQNQSWTVTISEGRNRQIRRTFAKLGYGVTKLKRTQFGDYDLGELTEGKYLIK